MGKSQKKNQNARCRKVIEEIKTSISHQPSSSDCNRQGRKQRHSISNFSHLSNGVISHSTSQLTDEKFNHSLFNDTTRLRRTPKRPSLSNIFSHEEPAPNVRGSQNKHNIRFFSPCRPKDPPPPPPPVASVLAPITPPKQFSPFELKRINQVINGGDQIKNGQSRETSESTVSKTRSALHGGRSNDTIKEEDYDDINDEFSTDEFSEDEFGTDEEGKMQISEDMSPKLESSLCKNDKMGAYQNIKDITFEAQLQKEHIHLDETHDKRKKGCITPSNSKHNIYDDVNTDIGIEEDSLEEKISFSEEYETEGDVEEIINIPSSKLMTGPVLSTKGQNKSKDYFNLPDDVERISVRKTQKENDLDIVIGNKGNVIQNNLIEKSGDKMIIFTSVAAQASSSHQEKRANVTECDRQKNNVDTKDIKSPFSKNSLSSHSSLQKLGPLHHRTSSSYSFNHHSSHLMKLTSESSTHQTGQSNRLLTNNNDSHDDEETFVDQLYPTDIPYNKSQITTKSDDALSKSSSTMAIKSDHQILISSSSLVDVKGISTSTRADHSIIKQAVSQKQASVQKHLNTSTILAKAAITKNTEIRRSSKDDTITSNKKGVLFEINSSTDPRKNELANVNDSAVDVNTISVNKSVSLNGGHSHYFDRVNGGAGPVASDIGFTLDSLEPIKPPRKKKMAKLGKLNQESSEKMENSFSLKGDINDATDLDIQRKDLEGENSLCHSINSDGKKTTYSKEIKMIQKATSQKISSHVPKTRTAESRQRRPNISAPILLATTLNPNDTDAHKSITSNSSRSSTFNPESLIHELQNNFQDHNDTRKALSSVSHNESMTHTHHQVKLTKSNTHKYYRSLSNPHGDQIPSMFSDHNHLRHSHHKKMGNSPSVSGGSHSNNNTTVDRITTFDDLKRYASFAKTSFNSALSNTRFNRQTGIGESAETVEKREASGNASRHSKPHKQSSKSKFYETDNLRETLYIQDSTFIKSVDSRPQTTSPYPSSEHIYEEIVECNKIRSTIDRPLPPIPEGNKARRKFGKVESKGAQSSSSNWIEKGTDRERSGSIFEGASKYDILHYLNNAKDRLGSADFEVERDDAPNNDVDRNNISTASSNINCDSSLNNSLDRTMLSNRKVKPHRVSSVSNASDCSTASSSSGNEYSTSSANEANSPYLMQGRVNGHQGGQGIQPSSTLNPSNTCGIGKSGWVEIERADSGVGSESSKSSKASVELRRAASLSKSSDSGSSSTSSNADNQELFALTNATLNNQNVCQDCDLICER